MPFGYPTVTARNKRSDDDIHIIKGGIANMKAFKEATMVSKSKVQMILIVAVCIILSLANQLLQTIKPVLADGTGGPSCSWPFVQPTVPLDQVDDVIIGPGQGTPASDKFRVRASWPDFNPIAPVYWVDVGNFTGFYPGDYATHQRGHKNEYPDTAIQVSETFSTVGMWLNSNEPDPSFAIQPDVSINAGCWGWQKQTFPTSNQGIKVSFDLQVPKAYARNAASGQVGFNLEFQDTASQKKFWFAVLVFDTRSYIANYHTVVPDLSGTSTNAIISTSIDVPGWMHKGANSYGFLSTQYTGYKHYEFRISPTEFIEAVKALKNSDLGYGDLSLVASNYRLTHFNTGPETHDPDTDTFNMAQIGMSIKNIQIGPYYPSHFIYMNGANTSSQNTMRIYFITAYDSIWNEEKAVNVTFPNGGGWTSFTANMSSNPKWYGTIIGIRFDPFREANKSFGIDYIRVGDVNNNYVQTWEFNDGTNPPTGWGLNQIGATWAESTRWGGYLTGPTPWFYKNNLNFVN